VTDNFIRRIKISSAARRLVRRFTLFDVLGKAGRRLSQKGAGPKWEENMQAIMAPSIMGAVGGIKVGQLTCAIGAELSNVNLGVASHRRVLQRR
jgi:hypothetical protein